MFLAIDHERVLSATTDLALFVNPYFFVYVLTLAASLTIMLLIASRRDRTSHLLFLGGVMLLLSNYATIASTSLSSTPYALLANTEPVHVGTTNYILGTGHLGQIHYSGWPLSFLLLAMFSKVLGYPDAGIPYVTFVLSTVLELLVMLTLYLLGNIFYGRGLKSVFLYYVCAFYFVGEMGGNLAGFSPQLFALPLLILYIILTYKSGSRPSRGYNALLLLLTFLITFSHLVTAIMLFCFLTSAFLLQKMTHSNTFRGLPAKISILCIALFAWLIYFVMFDFGAIFAPQTPSTWWYFLTRYLLSSAAGHGNPYFVTTTWYVALLKMYRTWINIIAFLSGVLGFLVFVRTERNARLRSLGMAIGFSFVGFAAFDIVFVRLFDNFWERIFSASYPFVTIFLLIALSLMASRIARSHTTLSLGPVVRKGVLGVIVCMLLVTSFLACNVSLTIGYSSSQFSTASFLSMHHEPDSTLGMSVEFLEILQFTDPGRKYWFDPIIYYDNNDIEFFVARLSQQPTLYRADVIARTDREVAFYYTAFGFPYNQFWQKVDYSLVSQAKYNRAFDSGSERIYAS